MESINVSKLTVGKQTGLFLECIISLSDLFNKTLDTLTEMYGEKRASEFFEEDFRTHYDGYEKAIQTFMCVSINENLLSGNTTII